MPPLKRQHFAPDTPTSVIGKRHDRTNFFRKIFDYVAELTFLKETGSGVANPKRREEWAKGFSSTLSQSKSTSENC
jgi:hypothetical protein